MLALAALLAACGQNQPLSGTEPSGAGQGSSVTPAPTSRTKGKQIEHDGFTYEIMPYKVHRLINNVPPGYALPIPSFRLDMVHPTDRGTTLFTTFTAHFRTAYRKSALTDARPFYGTSFTISSCQEVPALPEFCSFDLFEEDNKTLRKSDYQTIFADAAGNGIDGWVTPTKPIYLQFARSTFALRDGYQSSDFAVIHLTFGPDQAPVIDDVIIAQG